LDVIIVLGSNYFKKINKIILNLLKFRKDKNVHFLSLRILSILLLKKNMKYIKILMNITAFLASLIFIKAGFDATALYYRLGQMMELELDIPIWWMYLSFPVGFAILALFSIEMTIQAILDARKIEKGTN